MNLEKPQDNESLRPVLHNLLVTREEEKRAAALTLHDEIAQSLTVMSLQLQVMRKQYALDPATVANVIPEVQGILSETLKKVRTLEFSLYPKIVELSITDALKGVISRLTKDQGYTIQYLCPPTIQSERTVAIGLYRTVESLFTPSGLNLEAEWSIRLAEGPAGITLSIAETSVPLPDAPPFVMDALLRERVSAHGGEMTLSSEPTRIDIVFPKE